MAVHGMTSSAVLSHSFLHRQFCYKLLLLLIVIHGSLISGHTLADLPLDSSRYSTKTATVADIEIVENQTLPIYDKLEYFIDETGKLTLEELLANEQNYSYQPLKQQSLPVIKGVFWFRFTVKTEQKLEDQVVINFEELLIDSATLYYQSRGPVQTGSQWSTLVSGADTPFSKWPLAYPYVAFPMKLAPGAKHVIYVQLRSSYLPLFSPTISTLKSFAENVPSLRMSAATQK